MATKIKRKKLGKKVLELKAQGLSDEQIAQELENMTGEEITPKEVRYYQETRKNSAKQVLAYKNEFKEQEAQKYFDTIGKINKLNKDIWDIYYPLLNLIKEFQDKLRNEDLTEKKAGILTKLLNSLSKQTQDLLKIIEHVDKIVGKLQSGQNVTFNVIDMSSKIAAFKNTWEKKYNVKFPPKTKFK